MKTFVIVAGGTGGHVFAAESLANALDPQNNHIIIVTDQRGAKFLNFRGQTYILNIRHNSGLFYFDLAKVFFKQLKCLYKIKPDAVIGFGGYPSLPSVLAAQILRIPTIIHEQNAVLGRANRILSFCATCITGAFEDIKKTKKEIILTGNPIREEFLHVKPFKISKDQFCLLILGGSQGARIFSHVVPKALIQLPEEMQKKIVVMQQCRNEDIECVQKEYAQFKGSVELKTFFEDMDDRYEKAHFVISRSGASTVTELCITGRPSLLIPYSASLDGDQWNNAMALKEKGACFVMSEYHFTVQNLKNCLNEIMKHKGILNDMGQKAKKMLVPNASFNIARIVYKYLS